MKYFVLFAILGLFSIAGSKDWKLRIAPVNGVKTGKELYRAEEKTFQAFFDRRMYVTDKKWQPCDILLTTDSFIYYGDISHDTIVYQLSKVRANEVLTRFPLSVSINGDSVRTIAEEMFARKYPQGPKWWMASPIIYRDNGILVKFSRQVSDPVWHTPDRKKTLTDSVLLSKTDLSIIK